MLVTHTAIGAGTDLHHARDFIVDTASGLSSGRCARTSRTERLVRDLTEHAGCGPSKITCGDAHRVAD